MSGPRVSPRSPGVTAVPGPISPPVFLPRRVEHFPSPRKQLHCPGTAGNSGRQSENVGDHEATRRFNQAGHQAHTDEQHRHIEKGEITRHEVLKSGD